MPVIKIEPGKLGTTIRLDAKNVPKVIRQGIKMGAHRGRTHMVRESPVDRGVLKNAWEVQDGFSPTSGIGGVELVNTSPYAGVLERGARPGAKYGPAAVAALTEWVIRKIIMARTNPPRRRRRSRLIGPLTRSQDARLANDPVYKEARSIAFAILEKWKKVGRKGTFFVRDSRDKLARFAMDEIFREVKKYFDQGGGTNGNVQP